MRVRLRKFFYRPGDISEIRGDKILRLFEGKNIEIQSV